MKVGVQFLFHFICLSVFFSSLVVQTNAAITITNNGYENIVVALSNNLNISDFNSRRQLLDSIKSTFTAASKVLFEATDYTVYFKSINILLPSSWTDQGANRSAEATYFDADVRIDKVIVDESSGAVDDRPRSHRSKPCGHPGEYIQLSPDFFLDPDGSMTRRYGDRGKVLVHEWAHHRYGVFEEYGYKDSEETTFPYFFQNHKGHFQVSGCNNTEIKGNLSFSFGESCKIEELGCRFRPDLNAADGPVSSMMYMNFLPTVNRFCNSTTHDATVPNKQNYFCRNRSVWTVMKRTEELRPINPISPTINTAPTFQYLLPASPVVYIVLDVSGGNQQIFTAGRNFVKDVLLFNISNARSDALVGLATIGGFNTTTPGSYLTELSQPVHIGNNIASLRTKLETLNQAGSGLNLDQSLHEITNKLFPYRHHSGSMIVLLKFNPGYSIADTESDAIFLLNSRNIRVVTTEYVPAGSVVHLERIATFSDGSHFQGTSLSAMSDRWAAAAADIVLKVAQPAYISKRILLGQQKLNISPGKTYRGYYPIDWSSSESIVFNFLLPSNVNNFQLTLSNPVSFQYTTSSPEFSSSKFAWNGGRYTIHSFTIPSDKHVTGYWTYQLDYTAGPDAVAYLEAFYLLLNSTSVGIGGGGTPTKRLYEIEVFTTGINGQLDMSLTEDTPFLIYAAVRRGSAFVRNNKVFATIHEPSGTTSVVQLNDNVIYPDMESDGVYTGFYRPKENGLHWVSVSVSGSNPNAPASTNSGPYSYALPINQDDDYCCGTSDNGNSLGSSRFQRLLPYTISLNVIKQANYQDRPQRIMDLRITDFAINPSPPEMTISLQWTAPRKTYSTNLNESVEGYDLVYQYTSPALITENGDLSANAKLINSSQIISGSLTPAKPSEVQEITIKISEPWTSDTILLTIAGYYVSGPRKIRAYPAPMVYPKVTFPALITTSSPTTATPSTSRSTTQISTPSSAATTPTATPSTSRSTTQISTPSSAATTASTTRPTTTAKTSTLTPETTTPSSANTLFVHLYALMGMLFLVLYNWQ